MIHAVLFALAIAYVAGSLFLIQSRPGYFASVCVNSYPLAVFFGNGIGGGLVLIGALIALVQWAKKRQFQFVPGEIILAAWLAAISLSLLFSFQFEVSGLALTQLLGLGGGMYIIARTYGDDDRFISDLIWGCVIGVLICAPQLLINQANAPIKDVLAGRLGSVSGLQPVGLAGMLEVPIAGLLAIAFFGGYRRIATIAMVAAVLFVFTPLSISLGTRSLIAGVAIVTAAYVAIHAWQTRSMRVVGISILAVGLVALIAFIIVSELAETRLGTIILLGLNRVAGSGAQNSHHVDASTLERLKLYAEAWRLFLDAPLFGHGIGSFQYLADIPDRFYPHNLLLELLVTCGLVGTLAFSASLIPMSWNAFVTVFKRPVNYISVFVFGLLLIAMFRQQVSGSLSLAKSLFFAFGLCAARYAASQYHLVPRRTQRILESDDGVQSVP